MKKNTTSMRAWLLATLCILLVFVATFATMLVKKTEPVEPVVQPSRVLLVGFSGIDWDSVNAQRTPALTAFAEQSVVGNLVVKTAGVTTCAESGWLTLGAGERTAVPDCGDAVAIPDVARSTWLGEYLDDGGASVAALGSGSRFAVYNGKAQTQELTYDAGVATNAADVYAQVKASDVVVLDLGRAFDGNAGHDVSPLDAAFAKPGTIGEDALASMTRIDAQFADVLAEVDDDVTVIVASVGDADSQTARLQVFAMRPAPVNGESEQVLTATNSTRQSGLVQLTDIAPTILHTLGMSGDDDFLGSVIEAGEAGDVASLVDVADRALAVRPAVGPFYVLIGLAAAIFIAAACVHLSRGRELRTGWVFAGLFAVSLPVASFIANAVPWWRGSSSTALFLILVIGIAALIAGVATTLRRYLLAPLGVVAALTAGVIAVDAMWFGSFLHASSVMGDSPQSGGRFYGLSNAPFTIFAISMVLLTVVAFALLSAFRATLMLPLATALMAASAIIVDGAPTIGADFGGPPAILAGFLVLLFLVLGKELTKRRAIIIAVAAAGSALLVSFVDWLRPEDSRTHLGNFFDSLIHGEAFATVYRKAQALLTSVPWFVWFAVIAFFVAVWIYRAWIIQTLGLANTPACVEAQGDVDFPADGARPADRAPQADVSRVCATSINYAPAVRSINRAPAVREQTRTYLRWATIAIVVLVTTAVVINDSGVVIAFFGVLYTVPLLLVTLRRN